MGDSLILKCKMPSPFIPRIEFKAQRLARSLTPADVACLTKVNRASIERYERGTQDLVSEKFLKLLDAFGFTIVSKRELNDLRSMSVQPEVEQKILTPRRAEKKYDG